MQKIIIAALISLVSSSIFANPMPPDLSVSNTPAIVSTPDPVSAPVAANPANKMINLKITFNYQHKEKDHHDEFAFNNNMQMDIHNHEWIIIQSNPIVLLSKIEKSTSKTVKLQFLVIDPGKNSAILSQPEMVVSYGKKGEVLIKKDNAIIQLNVLANT
jgi:hypothetical protein